MERIPKQTERELIGRALDMLPIEMVPLVESNRWLQFFTSGDPVFSGVHFHKEFERGGKDYLNPHYIGLRNVKSWVNEHDFIPTIIISNPELIREPTILHEVGHRFHDWLDHNTPIVSYTTRYSHTNDREKFAEAFRYWRLTENLGAQYLTALKREDFEIFNHLLLRLPS
jgi:hypothetical protein